MNKEKEASIKVYAIFSKIPLDVSGSNLEKTGWMPSESDRKLIGEEYYKEAVDDYNSRNSKVLFKNVHLHWDSCDCGGGYPCSHGSYVYEVCITNGDKVYTVDFENGEDIIFEGNGKYIRTPIGITVFDFIRACELCEIELEFSDYAMELLDSKSITIN